MIISRNRRELSRCISTTSHFSLLIIFKCSMKSQNRSRFRKLLKVKNTWWSSLARSRKKRKSSRLMISLLFLQLPSLKSRQTPKRSLLLRIHLSRCKWWRGGIQDQGSKTIFLTLNRSGKAGRDRCSRRSTTLMDLNTQLRGLSWVTIRKKQQRQLKKPLFSHDFITQTLFDINQLGSKTILKNLKRMKVRNQKKNPHRK